MFKTIRLRFNRAFHLNDLKNDLLVYFMAKENFWPREFLLDK